MDRNEASQPFRNLKKRVEEVAAELGLELQTFATSFGNEDEDSDFIYVTVGISREALDTSEEAEQRQFDIQFGQMMSGFSLEEQMANMEEELRNWTTEGLDETD